MPLPLDSDTRDALRARRVAIAWLLDIECEGGALYVWNQRFPMSYDHDYESGETKWGIASELRCGRDLVPQPLTIWLDGATQFDPDSFTGRFLARKWHTRPIRLRQLICVPGTNFATPVGIGYEWRGFIDTITAPWGQKGQNRITLNCESGTFRARARNMTTLTDADQRVRDPSDGAFKNTATKPYQDLPFGDNWSNIPGSSGVGPQGNLAAAPYQAPSLFKR